MDNFTYDLSSEVNKAQMSPFLSRNVISIIDDNSTNYASGIVSISSAISVSSNKWLCWREAYLQIPILISVTTDAITGFAPATPATGAPFCCGLKNFYGSIIHSMSISMGGSVLVQQQNFVSMLSCFRLMTTLSYDDVRKNGST